MVSKFFLRIGKDMFFKIFLANIVKCESNNIIERLYNFYGIVCFCCRESEFLKREENYKLQLETLEKTHEIEMALFRQQVRLFCHFLIK